MNIPCIYYGIWQFQCNYRFMMPFGCFFLVCLASFVWNLCCRFVQFNQTINITNQCVALFFFPAVFILAVLKVSSNIIQRFNVCMNENATIPTGSMACLFSQVPAHRRFLLRMLLLPCVLGEFRTQERGDEAAKQIIGLPDT